MAPIAAEVAKKYSYAPDADFEIVNGLVGMEKAGREQQLHRLTHVFLPNADVTDAGPPGEVASVCGEIEELDLESNPISEWAPILDIALQLPGLTWLGLNRLQLAPLPALPESFAVALGRLRSLCLSRTGMAWDQLLLLASALPELTSLHFGGNGVRSLAPSDGSVVLRDRLGKLQTLWVEDNAICSWEAVVPLSDLLALETLNLSGNQLAQLPNPPEGFRALKQILLRGNPICGWDSISGLGALPSLRDAALRDLPLLADLPASSQRRSIIARLGGLEALNGSEVRKREREDAERFYLRSIAEQYPQPLPEGALPDAPPPGSTPSIEALAALLAQLRIPEGEAWRAIEAEHPRWRELLCLHGEQRKAAVTGSSTGVISAELIEIMLRSTAADSGQHRVLLYERPHAHKNDIPEVLDDDLKRLCDFGVVGGGTIIIEEQAS